MNKKPICFIAMAFDHDDTDQVYEELILPILKRSGVIPIIINRRQSNDDLNVQIIEQLEQADFCIADLTYTRPSVYFEAGFAQRSIPVIYTVRKDHLRLEQPENLRVHFDLQMKPIIVWNSPNDNSFGDKLENRLRATILRDWQRNNNKQSQNESGIREFNSLSLNNRLRLLRRQAILAVRRVGIKSSSFAVERSLNKRHGDYEIPRGLIYNGFENYIAGETFRGKKLLYVSIQTFESVKQNDLKTMEYTYLSSSHYKERYDFEQWKKIDTIFANIIIISLKPLSANQIEKNFEYCAPIEQGKTYSTMKYASKTVYDTHRHIRRDHDVEILLKIHFLSGIESFAHSKSLLDSMITDYLARELRRKLE
jgi:hypothetical protein